METIGSARLRIINIDNPEERLEIDAPEGEALSRAIWLSGRLSPLPLCGGLALCGRCAAILENPPPPLPEDIKYFSVARLARGWRLTCRRTVKNNETILLPSESFRVDEFPELTAPPDRCCLGIDLGTTSLEWRAAILKGTIASGKTINPQAGAGADIVSRLSAARKPDSPLADLALSKMAEIVEALETRGCLVSRICVAANSAMTEILLRKDISGLCAAPYSLSYFGNEIIDLELGGRKIPGVFPPLVSPFIGGDSTCALLACKSLPTPLLLADLGTNAEFLLLDGNGDLYATSVPMGPALEGVGPACGGMAAPGATVSYALTPNGLAEILFASGETPKIGATGYLSLLAILLRAGIMKENGSLELSPPSPMARKLTKAIFQGEDRSRVVLPRNLFLLNSDIELLLKAKAAFSSAIKKLLSFSGLAPDDLESFCLAGALGSHANIADLVDLGFIPSAFGERARILPSAALDGACALALNPAKLGWLERLRSSAKIISLADDEDFFNSYLAEMRWLY